MDNGNDNQFERLQGSLEELMNRFNQLVARIEELEHRRDRSDAPINDSAIVVPPLPKTPIVTKSELYQETELAGSDHATETSSSTSALEQRIARQEAFRRSQMSAKKSKAKPRAKPKKEPFDFSKFEWLLGTRGLAIAGMLIVVVGVGMFLKMAVDEGWIAAIPPAIRIAASAIFGLGLVGVGELFRRKINPLASSGVSATGIAVVYATILAAIKLYSLIDTPVAFILLVMITLGGVFLGSLSNRVMLAMLSLIGAFGAPILLSTGEPSYVVMPAYLLALLALGLVLSGWRGGAYAHVRRLAWWGTGLLGTMWLTSMYEQAPTSSLVFVSLIWLMTVVELAVSSRFLGTLRDKTKWDENANGGFIVSESGEKTFDPSSLFAPEARWINALFGVTIWAVVAAALTIREFNEQLEFIAPLGFAIGSGWIAFMVIGPKSDDKQRLWAKQSSPRSALAAAMTINAALLGAATIAVGLGGWVQVIAWAMVGLGAIETARRLRFRAAGIFGFALIGVAIARLLTLDFLAHLELDAPIALFGLAFSAWSAQMAFIALVCVVASWRSRYVHERRLASCVALWMAAMSFVHMDTQPDSLGAMLLVLAAGVAWITAVIPIAWVRVNAFVLAAIGMCIAVLGQFSFDMDYSLVLDINVLAMVIGGLSWVAIAALPGARFDVRFVGATLAVASGAFAIGKIDDALGTAEMLLFGAIYAGGIVALGLRFVRWSLVEIGSVLLGVVAIGWAAHQINLGGDAFEGIPLVHLGFASAFMVVALSAWTGWLLPKRAIPDDAPASLGEARRNLTIFGYGLAWMLLLASTSIEAVRAVRVFFDEGNAGGAAVSIWWSLFAILSVAIGFRIGAALRWAGLGLLGVVAVKVLIFDTVTLNQPARIIASISVGLVIIAAGVLYARLVDVVKASDISDEIPESEADSESD